MAQHFLLSAKSRSLSLKEIYKAGNDTAYETFKNLRWSETNGEPVCPDCGCLKIYTITTRKKFKCSACYKQFSVTSGTIFASHKLDFCDILAAICLFVNASKGMSAVQFSRDLNVQYKTAWVMAHKLREIMQHEPVMMTGEVEIDGAYVGGHIRPKNKKEDRVDTRKKENKSSDRMVVIALRERGGLIQTFIGKEESEGVDIAKQYVDKSAKIFADEARHWDHLDKFYTTGRINHSKMYSDLEGNHTNNVESFFSRLRRMIEGQHHFVSSKYLYQYANHSSWLEDNRKKSNGDLTYMILGDGLHKDVSRTWKGYWQR